jgi:hypothetical protein
MAGLALAAILWAIARACFQSITQDEAATFRSFVDTATPNHWAAHSNNHVLNSLLMRLSVNLLGLSQLTVRIPALLGASIYIVSCYVLCRCILAQTGLRIVVFICLIFNPYVGDFYLVARGYSLAMGFLMGAIAVITCLQIHTGGNPPPRMERSWMLASALLGLSFVANFPFAFINATSWAALMLWTLASMPQRTMRDVWRLLAASAVPGLLVVVVLASGTLLEWPPGQLFDGTRSLAETFRSVTNASLHEPNGEIANPFILSAARLVRPFLIPVLSAAAVLQLFALLLRRHYLSAGDRTHRIIQFSLLVAGSLAAALLLHWIAFRLFGLLLPRNRMFVYAVPFWTLAVGAIAATPSVRHSTAEKGRVCLLGLLSLLALHYGVCLRSGYFYEWWVDAEAKEVYHVLAYYNHTYNVIDVPARPPMLDCLEFYRRVSRRETLAPFDHVDTLPYGRDVYVLYEAQDRKLIEEQALKIVYRGRIYNEVVVAIRPGLEDIAPGTTQRPDRGSALTAMGEIAPERQSKPR